MPTETGPNTAAPVRPVHLAQCSVVLRRDGETLYLDCPEPLQPYARCMTERLEHWAKAAPDRVFLAERTTGGGWHEVTYAAAWRRVRRIAAALLARGLGRDRPVAILSGNAIEHALLAFACQHVGIPSAAVSPAYSLAAGDYAKLRHVIGLLNPGMVYAAEGGPFAKAILDAVPLETDLVLGAGNVPGRSHSIFEALMSVPPGPEVDAAYAAVGPDTVAKLLFTSGSTGLPKAVITTQRMLCANQQQMLQTLKVLGDVPPVIVDGLPWNHAFGGNHNLGAALYNGGSFYIDDGSATAAGMARSVRNLTEIPPTLYFNTPQGYEALIAHLRSNDAFRKAFYSRLDLTVLPGACLPPYIWDALDEIAVEETGETILMLSGLGAAESAPYALWVDAALSRDGGVGLPCPGLSVKLVPSGGKLEARLAGPNITPGYWGQPGLTKEAFDEEGYYRLGDALRFADPQDASKGLIFDGRLSEDFQLDTGAWVSTGPLRARTLAQTVPQARDVVLAGVNRGDVRALIFPDLTSCRQISGLGQKASAAEVIASQGVRDYFAQALGRLAASGGGSSNRIAAAVLQLEPPSLDAGEAADMGRVNPLKVLERRAAVVEALYAGAPGPEVILPA